MTAYPHLGYYKPDIKGLIADIRKVAAAERAHGRDLTARLYDGWIARLKGEE